MSKKIEWDYTESAQEYFLRVCSMKDELGMTWFDIADIINEQLDQDFDESYYRKRYKRITQDQGRFERLKDGFSKVPESRDLRREARKEVFIENLRNTITRLSIPEFQEYHSCPLDSKEYVLCIADIQGGACFTVNDNNYSLEECWNRFKILRNELIRFVDEKRLNKLHIVELGDTLQGILRTSDLQLNESSVVEALVTVCQYLASFLNEMSKYCMIEYYHVPASNHTQTRPLGTKASELATEDLEYVIGHYIKDMLSYNERVNVHLNDGSDHIEIPIFDFHVIAMHGHTLRNFDTALSELSVKHRRLLDYVFVGHWHVDKTVPGNEQDSHDTELLLCPSFVGTDPYSYNRLGKSAKAACKIYGFDPVYGLKTTEKIILN